MEVGVVVIERSQIFNREVKVYSERPKTVAEMFEASISDHPQKQALVMGEVRQTYK